MKKPKRGRPALAASEKKQVFALRLTPSEHAAIEEAARMAGESTSSWARRALLLATQTKTANESTAS